MRNASSSRSARPTRDRTRDEFLRERWRCKEVFVACNWVEESYRNVAPRKLVIELDVVRQHSEDR
jgi:hypothetical protein